MPAAQLSLMGKHLNHNGALEWNERKDRKQAQRRISNGQPQCSFASPSACLPLASPWVPPWLSQSVKPPDLAERAAFDVGNIIMGRK